MNQYYIKINYKSDPIEAEDKYEAEEKFFQEIESEPQQTLGDFINDITEVEEIPNQEEAIELAEDIVNMLKNKDDLKEVLKDGVENLSLYLIELLEKGGEK